MPDSTTHYQVLELPASATPAEIKSAYRRLAKVRHPDRRDQGSHEAIVRLNQAYEVLSDPLSRRAYDQQLHYQPVGDVPGSRQEREAAAQAQYRRSQRAEQSSDELIKDWLKKVYTPGVRAINQILKPLKAEVRALSADPFDDELMGAFANYIETSRATLGKVERQFRSVPSPPSMAGIAAHIYYCINQISDGLNELEYFTMNYDENSLHTGCEMFRIAKGLLLEAQDAARVIPK